MNAQLPWQQPVLDSKDKLLAWYHPEKNLGYDQVLRLSWDFLEHKVPNDTVSGGKIYLTYAMYDEKTLQGFYWQHNPASTFAHFVDVLVNWYPYSGDEESIRVVREMLDYLLAHGTTPSDWNWAGVPFPTSCAGDKDYGRCLQGGMPREFYGGIETDKVAEVGLAYVNFYEITGEKKYLDAGLRCADALVKHHRAGDAQHTPWPFRLDARSGETLGGEEFGGMIIASVRLFDELARLNVGDATNYRSIRDAVWKWMLEIQINENPAKDRWTGYYEDVPTDSQNINDMNTMMTAYYILSQDDPAALEPDPQGLESWQTHVGYLLDRSRSLLGRGPFLGAWAIDEQQRPDAIFSNVSGRGCCSRAGLSCRSAAWGAINAMYYERTGDSTARENGFRSLNYATYFMSSDGKFACCGASHGSLYWFEDGYADANRSFLWALGAVPDWAPMGQNHILRSSSVIQKVKYDDRRISYTTFYDASVTVMRLNFKPVRITAGEKALNERSSLEEPGYTVRALTGGDYVVRIRHSGSKDVIVSGR